ncbi:MAG: aromatic amino acid transport family protein [Chlamydiota bacterium]
MKAAPSYPLLGGSLLVAGSCIGAGMLALPILTGLSGFFPSLLSLLLAWAFMTYSACLVLEMNAWFPNQVNLLSMLEKGLGIWGKRICFFSYLFLFYSLLIAYISASSKIFSGFINHFAGIFLPPTLASVLFVLIFGGALFLGTRFIDGMNRFLMVGLGYSFFFMVFLGAPKTDMGNWLHVEWSFWSLSLPVLVLSFGFQNMIPSLSAYVDQDWRKMQQTIFGGSLIVFFVYLFWQGLLLGLVPFGGEEGILAIYQRKEEASYALKNFGIGSYAQSFAFFAIVTSFVPQALTLVHFLADGLNMPLSSRNHVFLVTVVLLPSLLFALTYPEVFYAALQFAGGVCTMTLFGILPVFAVWNGRYRQKFPGNYRAFGGRAALLCSAFFAFWLFFQELFTMVRSVS